ncbi:putative leucine-rich repeat receptor-like protein kinase [Canna indica]|uniref:non-specific serine/threonine protein kinase n=1 Tax=Canna indica TaxID=4628 RepID=A0AAQ3QEW4_9LILI|nr:putative leucine-rich repeat receptor-like protein kinase [Canna indica]
MHDPNVASCSFPSFVPCIKLFLAHLPSLARTFQRSSSLAGQILLMKGLLLLLLICFVFVRHGSSSTDPQDVFALRSLSNQWKNTPPSWRNSNDPCGDKWEGITCNNSRVTALKLFNMDIEGTLSSDIQNLTELGHLDLSYNRNLGGPLPPSIGNLKKLNTLRLIGCKFGDHIPDELGNLVNLNVLSLNSNQFIGKIPATLGRLYNLTWFDLGDNQLNGTLPISVNAVSGLDRLVNTSHFHLNKNQLSGQIPYDLFSSNMKALHILLDHNNFTGEIPTSIGFVQSLEILRLDSNSLNGPVPSSINNLTSLNVLNLANNKLDGSLPNMTGMHALNYLSLSYESLIGVIRIIESGGLEGDVPETLFSFPQLQEVRLDNNAFTGTLNMGSNVSKELKLVNFQNNSLTSVALSSNYNNTIILAGNPVCSNVHLRDTEYCHESQDSESDFSSINCLHPYEGPIICRAPSFGDISTNLGPMLNKVADRLNGTPVSFALRDYFFDGDAYLQVQLKICPSNDKYFTRNQILLWFDLSTQNLELPELYGPCYFNPSPYTFGHKANQGLIIGLVVGCTAAVIVIGGLGIYALWQKKRAKKAINLNNPFASWGSAGGEDAGDAPQLRLARCFSLEEMKKFTDDFSEDNKIGSGGYGKVYKGMLSDGQIVAIKRSQKDSTQGGLEFKTEVEMLSRVHHRNLVELIGFCFEKGERMLIYEYVSNGTLTENLSGRSNMQLDWKRRLYITLDSARGLAYLHELAKPPIIHRDVKSSNILLDDNLNAKVADFGLSMLVSDSEKNHVSTTVKGTLGYLDPEYFMTQQLTTKSDVYSFGVVMLELIAGRVPIEKGKYIVREVKMALDKDKEHYGLKDLIDPQVLKSGCLIGFHRFVDLALQCLEDSSEDRPTMNDIVKEIENLLKDDELKGKPTSATSSATSYGLAKDASQQPYDELLLTGQINSNSIYRSDRYLFSE